MTRAAALAMPSRPPSSRVAALASLLYGAFLLASTPASVVAWVLASSTTGIVTLEGARGGLWHGHAATLVVLSGSGSAQRFERLRWEWLGSRLIAGELAFRIEIEDPKLSGVGRFALHTGGVRVNDAALRFPASLPAAQVSALSEAALSGEFLVETKEFDLDKENFNGSAAILWHRAASTLSSVRPLGSYRAVVTAAGPQIEIRIETIGEGALHVEGHGTWSRGEGPSFDGVARPKPDAGEKLADLLRYLGPALSDGSHKLRIGRHPGVPPASH